jgi:hypothetical protein
VTAIFVALALWAILLAVAAPIYLVLCAISWVADRTWDPGHALASWLVKATLLLALAGAFVSVR